MEKIIKKECTVGYKWWNENTPNEVYYECGKTENGYCFKDEEAFNSKQGICYIPEYAYNEWHQAQEQSDEYIYPDGYTYEQILSACDGVEHVAKCVFCGADWQSMETLLCEGKNNDLTEIFYYVSGDDDWGFLSQLADIYDEEKYGTDWHNYYDFYLKHKTPINNGINAINKFMFYVWNYEAVDSGKRTKAEDGTIQAHYLPRVIMEAKWNCNIPHILEKWFYFTGMYTTEKAFMRFYADLSKDNRIAMLTWILENYNGVSDIA